MTRSLTLGTSVVLLFASLMVSAVLFGDLLPNHWIAFVLLPIIAGLLYYGALTAYYYSNN
ncbi:MULTISPECIES: hypothetical protein [Halomicrobium]|uniref:Uncharacterized protein n=2 Tax=Halomicrobium mukohataei TaxID=57705 RepID=C7NYM3_HALMD|nr:MULTISPECIES: hypothetical protein [Halomicrobium]ACV46684.1 hypothetical protein Hmuk_0550 [Halomicrobium mukohataei DSM 12286]QCD65193.1 hypothetical protein E5139_05885 [Halomicrobium mukohataei]QFR19999.1 hypothetical protein GBQ70_05880 [Halomicrobium sp. ZPS1]